MKYYVFTGIAVCMFLLRGGENYFCTSGKIWSICKYFEVFPMNVRLSSIFNYIEYIYVHTYECKHILHVLIVDSFLPRV